MLLVEHCCTYLCPVLKNMSNHERTFGMPEESWQILTEETKRSIGRRFLEDAETCLILSASDTEKRRIAEVCGGHIPGWYLDECGNIRHLQVRFTSPH